MSEMNTSQKPNILVRFFGWLWRFTIRLLLVLFFGVGLGLVLYFLVLPNLFQDQFRGIQENTNRIEALESSQSFTNDQMSERLSTLQERIVSLEVFRDDTGIQYSTVQEQLDSFSSIQATQQADMDSKYQEILKTLDDVSGELAQLQTKIDSVDGELVRIEATAQAADQVFSDQITANSAVITEITTTLKTKGTPLEVVGRELQVLKVMELVTRARLNIVEDNYGLARKDVETAHAIMQGLSVLVPEEDIARITGIKDQLELVLKNLPDDLVLASDALDTAWELLVRTLPPLPVSSTITSTMPVTNTLTPAGGSPAGGTDATPTPVGEPPLATPTVGVTPTPTPKP